MTIRLYDHDKDRAAAVRIWREVGWIDDENDEKGFDAFIASGRSLVGALDGPGDLSYHQEHMRGYGE